MTELSTHRLIQISQLAENARSEGAQLLRASRNARTIKANGYRKFALPRARRLFAIARRARLILAHAEWLRRRVTCPSRVVADLPRRSANALNIEVGQPAMRCMNKQPREWKGRGASSLRWLASGGSPLVFGVCSFGCRAQAAE